ncbi:DUF4232 domain-containing protein [Streptomyces sp. NPDC002671]
MSLHTRFFSRRGAAAALTACAAALATAGVAWSATNPTTATATASATKVSRASAAPRTCGVHDLYLSLGHKGVAAGSAYWEIRFTNTSTTSCVLRGYPGVSALDTAHHQIGPAAKHSGRSYSTVTLTPAHSASAMIRTTNGPLGGPCLRTGSYLRVYPPASYDAVLVPASWKICSNQFDVGPVNTEGAF